MTNQNDSLSWFMLCNETDISLDNINCSHSLVAEGESINQYDQVVPTRDLNFIIRKNYVIVNLI